MLAWSLFNVAFMLFECAVVELSTNHSTPFSLTSLNEAVTIISPVDIASWHTLLISSYLPEIARGQCYIWASLGIGTTPPGASVPSRNGTGYRVVVPSMVTRRD